MPKKTPLIKDPFIALMKAERVERRKKLKSGADEGLFEPGTNRIRPHIRALIDAALVQRQNSAPHQGITSGSESSTA
jgi:hypothetical protein